MILAQSWQISCSRIRKSTVWNGGPYRTQSFSIWNIHACRKNHQLSLFSPPFFFFYFFFLKPNHDQLTRISISHNPSIRFKQINNIRNKLIDFRLIGTRNESRGIVHTGKFGYPDWFSIGVVVVVLNVFRKGDEMKRRNTVSVLDVLCSDLIT